MSEITNPLDHTPPAMPTIEADLAVVEQAKGALMLRYGITCHEALALLLAWSREMGTTPHAVAQAMMNGACQGGETGHDDPYLVRWLREQLSDDLSRPPLW